jgi:hypothetical protein
MGRLRPGVGVRTATADLDAIAHRSQQTNPSIAFPLPKQFVVVAQTLLDSLVGNFKQTLYALLAAV